MPGLQSFGITDVGCRRQKNEDVILVQDDLRLYGVFDGLGGHPGGHFAALLACDSCRDTITESLAGNRALPLSDVAAQTVLQTALEKAHQLVLGRANSDLTLEGMGSTATIALFTATSCAICHVGDSRAYLIRDSVLCQLTNDHTIAEELTGGGLQPQSDYARQNFRRLLTRAIGFHGPFMPFVTCVSLQVGDIVLLCSDGLSEYFDDQTDRLFAISTDEKLLGQELIQHAKKRGGKDDVSAVLIGIR